MVVDRDPSVSALFDDSAPILNWKFKTSVAFGSPPAAHSHDYSDPRPLRATRRLRPRPEPPRGPFRDPREPGPPEAVV